MLRSRPDAAQPGHVSISAISAYGSRTDPSPFARAGSRLHSRWVLGPVEARPAIHLPAASAVVRRSGRCLGAFRWEDTPVSTRMRPSTACRRIQCEGLCRQRRAIAGNRGYDGPNALAARCEPSLQIWANDLYSFAYRKRWIDVMCWHSQVAQCIPPALCFGRNEMLNWWTARRLVWLLEAPLFWLMRSSR